MPMLVHAVLAASIALQFAAAALALRLIAVTARRLAWLLIAAALLLMAARRLITFVDSVQGNGSTPDLTTELVALFISAAMLAGVAAIRPMFQELREQQEQFKSFVENLHDAFYRLRLPDGTCEYVNGAVAGVFGLSREDCLARPLRIAEIIHPEDRGRFDDWWAGLLVGSVPLRFEYRVVDPSGRVRNIEQWNRAVFEESGQITALEGICRDVTEQVGSQQRLQDAMSELRRSNAEFQEFAHVVSHDLQEPLRMVISYLQLLERRAGPRLEGSEREFLAFAVNGGKRMSALIQDLLEYSRVGSQGQGFAAVAAGDAVEEALANLSIAAAEAGAEITCGPLPTVVGDRAQLVSLFQNLIGNALKYRAKDRPPRIQVTAELQPGRWLFSIRDNGIGIDSQNFERIFVIFQRLHGRDEYEGTGIGLAVARRIVERHGGRIWVESVPGEGSVFRFTLAAGEPDASRTVIGS